MKVKDTFLLLAFLSLVVSACNGNKNENQRNENRDNYDHSTDSAGTVPEYRGTDSTHTK